MKKKNLLPLLAVAALLTACDEERYDAPQLQKGVTFTVPDFVDEAGTRVAVSIDNDGAHFVWTEGDTLGVFPANGYQTAFPISNGQGTNIAIFDGADWALRPRASYAAYYPMQHPMDAIDKTAIEVSYLGQTQDGNGSTSHIGEFDCLASSFTGVDGSGNASFDMKHLGCLVRFQLTMPEADTYTSMTLSCDGSMLTTAGKFDLTAANPALAAKSQDESISLILNNIATTEANQVLTLYMMLPPMDLSSKNLSIKVSGEKEYEATIDGKNMKAGNIYGYSNSMTQYHEYVDLGLPSGTMWATCNVGANHPEEYGGYYAWGETKAYGEEDTTNENNYNYSGSYAKTYYWVESYKYQSSDGTRYYYTKYNCSIADGTIDNKQTLESEDDAAYMNMGENWKTPTYQEMQELSNQCYWEWTDNYNETGVSGLIVFKAKSDSDKGAFGGKEGYTNVDVHIFLPAAGWANGNHVGNADQSSTRCCYMINALCGNNNLMRFISVNSSSTYVYFAQTYKIVGLSIRPVIPGNDLVLTSNISVTGTKTEINLDETLQLSAAVSPSNATNKQIQWVSNNTKIAIVSSSGLVTGVSEGTAVISAISLDRNNVIGSYTVTVSRPMHNVHESVDLGLSVKWATCNVGATQPEEYGDYFAWGETEPYYTEGHAWDNPCENWKSRKSGYNWSSYKYCNDSDTTMIKYCTDSMFGNVDNKTVLESADDAASVNWGGSWRMPTEAEQDELRNNCTWIWTTLNGVNGYNVVGPNGNSIFLSAAGCRSGSSLDNAGSYGNYWSSSLNSHDSVFACSLDFSSSFPHWNHPLRWYGLPIRPVCSISVDSNDDNHYSSIPTGGFSDEFNASRRRAIK